MRKRDQGRRTHPHLWGAMTRLTSNDNRGDCFWRAAGYVLDSPGAVLCAGIIRAATPEEAAEIGPDASLVPFFHAWCEHRGAVIAPTTFEAAGHRLIAYAPDDYYGRNGVRDIRRMDRPRLLAISREIGLARMLLGRQPKTSEPWGSRLLEELGFEWEIHETGGMVPPQ